MKLHKFNLLNNKLPSVVFIFDQSTVYNSYPRIYTSFAVSACSLAAFFASLSCLSKSSSLALAWYHKSSHESGYGCISVFVAAGSQVLLIHVQMGLIFLFLGRVTPDSGSV